MTPPSKKTRYLATFAVTVTAGLVVEWLKGFPVSRLVGRVLAWCWGIFIAGITIPVWLFTIVTGLALAFLVASARRLFHSPTDWKQYRRDTFLEINWHWDYLYDEIATSTLVPICPKCGYQMSTFPEAPWAPTPQLTIRCDDCGYARQFDGTLDTLVERIVKLIQRKLRTGEYLKKGQAA